MVSLVEAAAHQEAADSVGKDKCPHLSIAHTRNFVYGLFVIYGLYGFVDDAVSHRHHATAGLVSEDKVDEIT